MGTSLKLASRRRRDRKIHRRVFRCVRIDERASSHLGILVVVRVSSSLSIALFNPSGAAQTQEEIADSFRQILFRSTSSPRSFQYVVLEPGNVMRRIARGNDRGVIDGTARPDAHERRIVVVTEAAGRGRGRVSTRRGRLGRGNARRAGGGSYPHRGIAQPAMPMGSDDDAVIVAVEQNRNRQRYRMAGLQRRRLRRSRRGNRETSIGEGSP